VGYTQAAVDTLWAGFGASFVAIAVMLFAFTTIVAYYYMAETNLQYINRKLHRPWTLGVLKVAIIASATYGAVRSASAAWDLGDLGVGLMAWLNIVAILIVQKPALLALKDYESQKRAGVEPVFDPDALGLRNADLWRQPERPPRQRLAGPR
jgi:AGCS family alanine or glycine:cation symporter